MMKVMAGAKDRIKDYSLRKDNRKYHSVFASKLAFKCSLRRGHGFKIP